MIKLASTKQPKEVSLITKRVLESGRYVKGPLAQEFEQQWAKRCGMKYGIAVGSGAQALELAIQCLFDMVSDNMVTYTAETFRAVPNAISRMGGLAVETDHEPDIFAHHLHDRTLDYIPRLEDCSHCHGYKPIANTAIFSFFPTKILGACGEAGIIVTNSEYVYKTCQELRTHGNFPEEDMWGSNCRMDEIQAGILLAKLPYLDKWIRRRKEIVGMYDKGLGRQTEGNFHYAYCIPGSLLKKRKLIDMGIETNFYYTPKYMALPLHPDLTDEEVRRVIEAVKKL